MSQRRELVDKQDALSTRKQCDILSIHRSGLYYKPLGENQENLEIMRIMDEHYLKHPTAGVIRMQDLLLSLSFVVNHKRVRRLLRLMGLMAIYPKKNLSKLGLKKYIHPYLLKGLKIDRPNQVWAIDISAPGSDNLSNEMSPAVFEPAVEILPRCTREVWRKGAGKFYTVLSMRRNKQNSLKCTGGRPFPVGRATTESMMRQRSMRWKPLYLICQPSIKKWLWRYVVSSYGLFVAMREILCLVVGYPHSHYPEPPGVEHAI